MKKLLILALTVTSQLTFAEILNSTLEKRHSDLIENSVSENCGIFKNLTELKTSSKIITIDQGIHDVQFTTNLEGISKTDQNIYDTYEITVKSEYTDMYDHTNKDWGVFSVTSVKCTMIN